MSAGSEDFKTGFLIGVGYGLAAAAAGEKLPAATQLAERAEQLKADLRVSAQKLDQVASHPNGPAIDQVRRLLAEGGGVIEELEKLTKNLINPSDGT